MRIENTALLRRSLTRHNLTIETQFTGAFQRSDYINALQRLTEQ